MTTNCTAILAPPGIKRIYSNTGFRVAAQTVAERLRTLYSVPRKLMECTLPYSETLSIGSTLTLSFNSATYDGAVIAVADVFGEGPPVQRLSVLV